ncbi:MAG: hypothetical protein ABGW97_16845 [Christiangramia sp.]|uniref:hypothetical protein n=1 Tax=Christiangramia sp. TaxID=1931228 RepID=UPI003241D580
MKSILLYNLYPIGNWKDITEIVLKEVPFHDDIYVNVSIDRGIEGVFKKFYIIFYLKQYSKIRKIFFSVNNPGLGEVTGFEKFRKDIDFNNYSVVTYTHSKGVTKPGNKNIIDWVKMMTYFVIHRHDKCLKCFEEEFALYGAQLNKYEYDRPRKFTYKYCDFWYGGTFVSLDLRKLRREFINTECVRDYFGVEAFWGNLCEFDKAYSAHNSPFSLYDHPYPAENYIPVEEL